MLDNNTLQKQKLNQLITTLEKLRMEYEIIEHRPITSVQEGLDELGIAAYQGVSTLLLKADNNYITAIRRDDNKLNFKKIKKLLSVRNLQLATREKVRELTGSDIGYVSLYNENFKPLMDKTIVEQNIVYGGTGSPKHDLKIKSQDLITLTNARIVDIT